MIIVTLVHIHAHKLNFTGVKPHILINFLKNVWRVLNLTLHLFHYLCQILKIWWWDVCGICGLERLPATYGGIQWRSGKTWGYTRTKWLIANVIADAVHIPVNCKTLWKAQTIRGDKNYSQNWHLFLWTLKLDSLACFSWLEVKSCKKFSHLKWKEIYHYLCSFEQLCDWCTFCTFISFPLIQIMLLCSKKLSRIMHRPFDKSFYQVIPIEASLQVELYHIDLYSRKHKSRNKSDIRDLFVLRKLVLLAKNGEYCEEKLVIDRDIYFRVISIDIMN